DAIIMQPQEQDACSPAVDKAKAAGIPIVNCNSLTTSEPDAYVGSNDAESAEIAMTYIAEQLAGKGNVLMMHGHPGQTAELKRTEGALAVLEQYPDMVLLDEQTADWDRAKAMTLMENWMQSYSDQINAVFCQNDEMAMGALNALVQADKKDSVLVIGVDAIADALQSVKDGKLDATVYQDCKGQAEGSLDAAYKLAKGETVEKEILIP
ncbi:MAG: substrate-binding domain-containing protein, partial [Oscillospiraceae bacterium]